MTRSFKINKYNIVELVKIKIPKEDKGKTNRTYLPYKIINSSGNDKHLEILNTYISKLEEIPRKQISLRKAARLQSTLQNESQIHLQVVEKKFEVTCKCPKITCDTLHYPCKKLNRKCNLTCHSENNVQI
ncbi:3858_t:CDS:2 [Funneliformis geosporum]|uniref:3858_t:CDS:1 n=1 Tax=Funneliformis geosporum TaxID=1117311 RepID=A0A9W4WUA5_9GLOM|nr:3858_t:CDS:2 [Funneliformis geosporum]